MMLNGITIIETVVEPRVDFGVAVWFTVIGTIAMLLIIPSLIKDYMVHKNIRNIMTGIVAIVICCAALFVMWTLHNTIETTYRVNIDKSVSLVEFNEKYEIVSQNGDEYIIRDVQNKDGG